MIKTMKINLKKMASGLLATSALVLTISAAPVFATECNSDVATGGLAGAAACAQGKDQPSTLFGDGGIFQIVTNVLHRVIRRLSPAQRTRFFMPSSVWLLLSSPMQQSTSLSATLQIKRRS